MSDTDNTLTGENSKRIADADTVTAAAIEDVKSRILHGRQLALVVAPMMLAIFLVALDIMIVAPAAPVISSELKSLDELTWIITAFLITQAATVMPTGQILNICPSKYVAITVVALFEVGSLICALAPNMNTLIAGRVVQGAGAGPIFVTMMSILSQVTSLKQRPAFAGIGGAVFGIASIIGPVVGGALTSQVTWRWCFYINLPIGGVALIALILFLPYQSALTPPSLKDKTMLQKVLAMDWIGTLLTMGLTVSFLLPLFWGGNRYAWNDPIVIALFVVSGVLTVLFAAWETYLSRPDSAIQPLIPIRLFKSRTTVGTIIYMACIFSCLNIPTYYLPAFYQIVRGRTAEQSGVDIIPLLLSFILTTAIGGGVVRKTGRYWPFLIFGACISAVGGGLLFTIDPATSSSRLLGFQILLGFGIGLGFQNSMMSLQAEYAYELGILAQAMGLGAFFQRMGGALGISVAGSIFSNKLFSGIAHDLPNLSKELVEALRESVGALALVPEEFKSNVIALYVSAIDYALVTVVPWAGVAAFTTILIKNYSLHERSATKTMMDEAQPEDIKGRTKSEEVV